MSAFLAFDTETATPWGNEICSLALVLFEDGRATRSWSSLVNPGVRITPEFARFHGICDADVKDAPRFADLWAALESDFAALPVVAHNMAFDRKALLGELERAGLPAPAWSPYCTLKMARRLWPKPALHNHRLDTVAAHLGVGLNHHEALSDANACGHIAAQAQSIFGGLPDFARA